MSIDVRNGENEVQNRTQYFLAKALVNNHWSYFLFLNYKPSSTSQFRLMWYPSTLLIYLFTSWVYTECYRRQRRQRQKSDLGRSVGNPQAIRKDGCSTKSDAAQGVTLLQKWGIHWGMWLLPPGKDPCCELGQEIFLPNDDLNILMAQIPSIWIKHSPKGDLGAREWRKFLKAHLPDHLLLGCSTLLTSSPLWIHRRNHGNSCAMAWKPGLQRISISFDNDVSLTKELLMTSYICLRWSVCTGFPWASWLQMQSWNWNTWAGD